MNPDPGVQAALARAAAVLRDADALLIGAGAGMGVDSGLPDFRGDHGFWKAYPPLAQRGIRFGEIANPRSFGADPALAWGFYGHRLALYRATVPHEGFAILRAIGERMTHGPFVFTSNVDGQFERAGFDAARVVECHGSLHHLQCTRPCSDAICPPTRSSPRSIPPPAACTRPCRPARAAARWRGQTC
jgi:NAD-dependent SIR2 family protein deacetylase